jgi:adenylate cyclase
MRDAVANSPAYAATIAALVAEEAAKAGPMYRIVNGLAVLYLGLVLVTFTLRGWRRWHSGRSGAIQITYPGHRVVSVPPGFSVLEASRWAGIPHASVCGGRSLCSTCRIRVFDTAAMLAPLGPVELRTLQRIAAPPNVRLACQLRPSVDVSVVPLVPAGPDLGSGALRFDAGVEGGRELPIAAMFVDMRGSTRLATGRLPYLTAGDRLQFGTDGSADDEKNIAACVLILHDPLVTGCATPGALGIENLDFRRIHRPE